MCFPRVSDGGGGYICIKKKSLLNNRAEYVVFYIRSIESRKGNYPNLKNPSLPKSAFFFGAPASMFCSPLPPFSWLTGSSTGVGSRIRGILNTAFELCLGISLVEPPSGPDSLASKSRLVEGCRYFKIFWFLLLAKGRRKGG